MMGSARVSRVKLCNQRWRVYICSVLSAVVLITVTFPLDEVLESSSENVTIKDGFDFIMFLSIDQDGVWWWVTLSSWDRICGCGHQFDHRKDRV
jgi:hypothetical protein